MILNSTDDISPEYMGMTRKNLKIAMQLNKKIDMEIEEENIETNLTCYVCKKKINEKIYYKCVYHDTIFCYNCASNKNEKIVDFSECSRCKFWFDENCIYGKKEVAQEDLTSNSTINLPSTVQS